MADSTYPIGEDSEVRDARQRADARREITRDLDERGVAAAQAAALADAPLRLSSTELACAHIVCQSAVILADVWRRRRPVRHSEKAILRILGGLACRAGLPDEALGLALETAVEEMLEVVRQAGRTAPWRPTIVGTVLAGLEADAATFATTALGELQIGHRVERCSAADVTDVLRAAVDGPFRGVDLADSASAAGIDVSRPYGVVVLAGVHGATARAGAAAASIVERVPYAVDLGPSGLVRYRRVVVPQLSPAQWLEARIEIDAIARRHSLLAVAPAPCALADIAGVVAPLIDEVESLIARSGITAGILDPACVAPGQSDAAALPAATVAVAA